METKETGRLLEMNSLFGSDGGVSILRRAPPNRVSARRTSGTGGVKYNNKRTSSSKNTRNNDRARKERHDERRRGGNDSDEENNNNNNNNDDDAIGKHGHDLNHEDKVDADGYCNGGRGKKRKRQRQENVHTDDDHNGSDSDCSVDMSKDDEDFNNTSDQSDSDEELDENQRISRRVFRMLRDVDLVLNEANDTALSGLKDFVRQSKWSWSRWSK